MNAALAILHEVFPQLSADAARHLYDAIRVIAYPDKKTLIREGEIGDTCYILLEGEAEVYKNVNGQVQRIDRLGRGALFGEFALLLDRPRSADIVARGDVKVVELDRATFEHVIITYPEVTIEMTRLIVNRLLHQQQLLLAQLAEYKKTGRTTRRTFVSYASLDKDFVVLLVGDLEKQGINTWLDLKDIPVGTTWARMVGQALEECALMLLILSPNCLASPNVEDEWNYYLDKQKPIVPLLYQPCEIPYRLRKLQHIDFTTADYDVALARLVSILSLYQQ